MHFFVGKDDISFSLPTHLSVQQVEEDENAEEEDKVGLVVEFRPQTISKALRLCEHNQKKSSSDSWNSLFVSILWESAKIQFKFLFEVKEKCSTNRKE